MKLKRWHLFVVVTLFGALALPVAMAAQDNATQNHKPKHHTYRLIDLGTFGGPQSFVNIPNGYAPVLNNRGTVAGWADTSTADPHPNHCFTDCFVAHAFRSQGHGKTDLGALPAALPTSSQPNWIARNGLIAGLSENGEIDPLLPGVPEFRAVLWQEEGIIDLGTLEGGYESVANAVNSSGQVGGFFTNTIPDANSMFGFGFQTRAFLWQDEVMQDLGTLGGTDAMALLVNEHGQVVGESYTNSDPSPYCAKFFGFALTTGAFLWENGAMKNLGSFGGTCTFASDLNNSGQIVGISTLPGDQLQNAFLWDDGALTALPNTFGGHNASAIALSSDGDVVGWGDLQGDKFVHASLWKNGVQTDLGTVGKDSCSIASSINSKDQVVGVSVPTCDFSMPTRAFLFENGGIVDLNALIPAGSKLSLSSPETINDRGEIAGIGLTADGNEHAFLLIPNGDCDDECEDRIASQNNAAVAVQASPATSPINPNSLRNRSGRRRQSGRIPQF
jgi:probable HAF family extracellular repeat protein